MNLSLFLPVQHASNSAPRIAYRSEVSNLFTKFLAFVPMCDENPNFPLRIFL